VQTALRRHRLRIRVNGEESVVRVVLIGCNCYDVDLFTLGQRKCLDAGELQLRTAAGWLPRHWDERVAARFTIDLGGAQVRTAIDGEPVLLDSPLELETLPRALRVLLPGTLSSNGE
jgi:hypothetical protein